MNLKSQISNSSFILHPCGFILVPILPPPAAAGSAALMLAVSAPAVAALLVSLFMLGRLALAGGLPVPLGSLRRAAADFMDGQTQLAPRDVDLDDEDLRHV